MRRRVQNPIFQPKSADFSVFAINPRNAFNRVGTIPARRWAKLFRQETTDRCPR